MTQGRDWAQGWAEQIGANLRRAREERGLSAQQLSERCSELGYPIARNAIANLENKRKRDVPVQEIAVLAAALDVPPAELLYPLADGTDAFKVLPNSHLLPIVAVEWFTGGGQPSANYLRWTVVPLPRGDEVAPRASEPTDLERFRAVFYLANDCDRLVRNLAALQRRLDKIRAGAEVDEWPGGTGTSEREVLGVIEAREEIVAENLRRLQGVRRRLLSRGLTPSPVPESVRDRYSAIGGDDAES